MDIAVIILNHNSSDDCGKCIRFLQKQEGVNMDIIVVDNHSNDNDRKALEEICQIHGTSFIANDKNEGYNAGNNVGLRYAAGKGFHYALIINPDIEIHQKDYLQRMTAQMERDTWIAVCGSDVVTIEGIHQSPMKPEGDWKGSFNWIKGMVWRKPKEAYDFIDDYAHSHYCHKVSGCCLMVRMEFIKEIGYFDEYPFLYCEEAILSKQVEQSRKWKMYYMADIQAEHHHVKGEKGDPAFRFKQWRRSRIYYIDHYSGDHWAGRTIAKVSITLQIQLTSLLLRLKQ